MTIWHDLMLQPPPDERDLRAKLDAAQQHAEDLEEALLVPDPEEFVSPARHVEICFERQKAAHAWRKAGALQSQINGIENRRYFRSLSMWMTLLVGSDLLFKGGFTFANILAIAKALAGGG